MNNDAITSDDFYSYKKIVHRCDELAQNWLANRNYDLRGFDYTNDVVFDNGNVYFTIHWHDPFLGLQDCEDFELKFFEEFFCG